MLSWSWADNKDKYEEIAQRYDKACRLAVKEGWFWEAIAWILHVVTLGSLKRSTFMSHYATTIGPLQFYPRDWPRLREGLLVHEARHVRQCRWFGLGIHPWIGLPVFAALYLLLPLPLGLAYFRFRFELDADRVGLSYEVRNRKGHGRSWEDLVKRCRQRAEQVSGAAYTYSWPKKWTMRAYEKMAGDIWDKESGLHVL